MKQKTVPFLFSFFLYSVAWAEMGFHSQLPQNPLVEAKKNSIYKGYFATPPYIVFRSKELKKLNTQSINLDPEQEEAVYATSILMKTQLEQCQQTPDEDCYLLSSAVRGSLFFIENEATFYTTFHNLQSTILPLAQKTLSEMGLLTDTFLLLQEQAKTKAPDRRVDVFDINAILDVYKQVRVQSLPILIYNNKNEIIFGDKFSDETLSLDFPPELLLDVFRMGVSKMGNDFARVTINQPVGKALIPSPENNLNENIFVLGFPEYTDQTELGTPNSDGRQAYFTKGTLVGIQEIQKRTGVSIEQSEAQHLKGSTAFCDCESSSGNNGGVALNEKGQARFLVARSWPEDGRVKKPNNILTAGPKVSYVQSFFAELFKKMELGEEAH